MKTAAIAFTALAASTAACAQSSVTLFGIVDTNVQRLQADGAGSLTRVHNSGYNTSRLGFRGVEDLGGGYGAGFWLEMGMNNDSGAGANTNTNNQSSGAAGGGGLTFSRRATVSLTGPFGELRVGRDNTASFWVLNAYDPFNNTGSGNAMNLSVGAGRGTTFNPNLFGSARLSNTVAWLTPPSLGGFFGHFMVALGENPSNAPAAASKDGNYLGARVGYAQGPLHVSASHGRTRFSAGSPQGGDYRHSALGASYAFAPITVMGHVFRDEIASGANPRQSGWSLAATARFGPGEFRASFVRANVGASDKDGQLLALGYVHHLSKRTALYATYARVDNKGGGTLFHNGIATTVPGGDTKGIDVGIRHAF